MNMKNKGTAQTYSANIFSCAHEDSDFATEVNFNPAPNVLVFRICVLNFVFRRLSFCTFAVLSKSATYEISKQR